MCVAEKVAFDVDQKKISRQIARRPKNSHVQKSACSLLKSFAEALSNQLEFENQKLNKAHVFFDCNNLNELCAHNPTNKCYISCCDVPKC